jgi:hypothetical protein
MSTNDEMGTNDDAKQRLVVESKNPQIRVRTEYCMLQSFEFDCMLDEPASGSLRVEPPFVVSIVNDRDECSGRDRKVEWKIGSALRTLQPGETASHTMLDVMETLELFYDNCRLLAPGSPGAPEPPTTPRVTINLIKSRNV